MFMLATVQRIADLADAHAGYFTASEALVAGVSRRVLSHHVVTGTLERVEYGIYRLHRYPAGRFEDLVVVGLWAGADAAISHESALVVFELGEAMAAVTHVTVPRPFRGRRPGVIVHHAPLGSGERVLVDSVAVTSVERTLIDVAGSADPALAQAAARDALDRGLTTRRRLGRAVRGNDMANTILGGAVRGEQLSERSRFSGGVGGSVASAGHRDRSAAGPVP
jgi:predicted transcriptional regulator of viral defense system